MVDTTSGFTQSVDTKHPFELDCKAWSKLCESTRKDVECVFGILKKRFRILATPFLESETQAIDTTFKVCAILHNMSLKQSGLSNIGTDNRHWRLVDKHQATHFGLDLTELNDFHIGSRDLREEATVTDACYEAKRAKLVKHYSLALAAGEVYKRRTAADIMADLEVIDDDHIDESLALE